MRSMYVLKSALRARERDGDAVDGCEFSFFCRPYLLRLNFPSEIVDTEALPAKAVYDMNDRN